MAKRKATKKGNGKAEPLVLYTDIIPVPRWKSREDALDYMRGEFCSWNFVVQDLMSAGAHVPGMMLVDLMKIAETAAEFIATPGAFATVCDSFEHADDLVRSLRELRNRTEERGYFAFKAEDGWAEVSGSTYPLLARALQRAGESYEREAVHWWNSEMESREALGRELKAQSTAAEATR